ncbi:asparaginase [Lipingzhangella sp. LS1_29]|uniref:Asparaginase n=1 Tax=Lipingzhangella rawalii TaxID=2055835 RepID=A0ABU2HC71_9ACTN|nr:asparaginase [Lipingzhangella rawalii]MDS1272430.1 asparaginase [Lipingzhangella rawalii]
MPTCEDRPRVVVYGLGGTIAMAETGAGGVVPALSASQLLQAVPGLSETGIDIDVEDYRRMPGASLDLTDITALAAHINKRLASGTVDGIVVTQGTDTIEETSYLLDVLNTAPQPIVITGAMRNPTLAGADGPANLLAAIQTAAHPSARQLGALVVLADEIHAASRVRKTHTTSGSAFQSPNGGPLGYLVEGIPRVHNQPTHRYALQRTAPVTHPRVALVTMCLGDDGVLLDGLAERSDGVVIAAFGVGHVPQRLLPMLDDLAGRVPAILASRAGAGSGLATTYAFPGSEQDLLHRGWIRAGFLDPLKARVLLWTLLATGHDHSEITEAFAAAGGYTHPASTP